LLIHISVAILSIAQATFALVSPSRAKLGATYGLVAATLATGTYLVVQQHAPLMSSCMSGLTYLSVVLGLLGVAQYRFAKQIARR
jgi:hypothetical protein